MELNLRHTLATLAYRAGKALRDAPESFANFTPSDRSRTPVQILAHMGDLFDWALSLAKGKQEWHDAPPLPWDEEVSRFFRSLEAFDSYLAAGGTVGCSADQLFQGPIADALTHTGQLKYLRGMAAIPVRPENYFKATIAAGQVGKEQAKPKVEF